MDSGKGSGNSYKIYLMFFCLFVFFFIYLMAFFSFCSMNITTHTGARNLAKTAKVCDLYSPSVELTLRFIYALHNMQIGMSVP